EAFQKLAGELAADPGLRVMVHATVTELRTDDAPCEVSSVAVASRPGHTFRVEAGRYVLACGGIDNARLLLASTSRSASGVGNQHDLVGRFFQEHLAVRSGDWSPSARGLAGSDTLYDALEVDGSCVHAKIAPSPEVVRKQGLLNTTFFLDPMSRSRASAAVASVVSLKHALRDRPVPGGLTRHAGNVVRGAPHVARVAGEVLAGRRGRPVAPPVLRQLRCMAEQAPNPLSRVRLDGRRRDALGVPTAVLDWQLSELDRVSLRRAQDVVATAFETAGLGRITRLLGEEAPAADVRGQWHHMGTTRMAREPRQGVVDPAGRVHGMSNLYVTGSSVFPTSGYANPTLTILALALRLASHLRERPARR
ncbi:MAG: oxidoreductase, partial [Frankiales bacterium]|nr:oxidoreductase [Frankiales bacterium]